MLITKIRKDFSRRKLRSILTIIGLSISVLGVTGVAIANSSVISSAEKAFGITSAANIEIVVRTTEWNSNTSSQLKVIPGLIDYEQVYRVESAITVNNKNYRLSIWGINISKVEGYNSLYGIVQDVGSTIPNESKNELFIDSSAARSLDISIGETLTLPFPTSNNTVNKIDFNVTGLARAVRYPGFAFTASIFVWMSIERLQSLYESAEFNHLYLKNRTDNKTELEEVAVNVSQLLDNNDIFVEEINVFDIEEDIRVEIISSLNSLLSISVLIGIIIGGVLTTSTIQIAIANEREDISLMKILGAKKHHIFFTYICEAGILGLLGGVVGTLLSIAFALFLVNTLADPLGLSTLSFVIPPSPIITGFLFPVFISIIFATPIILGSVSISPMELFRKSASSKTKQKQRNSRIFTIHTFSFANLTRKRVRLGLNLIILTIAIGAVVGFSATGDSTLSTITNYFDEDTKDIEISFPNPSSEITSREFVESFFEREFPGEIKSWSTYWWMYPIQLSTENIEYSKGMSLLGIHANSPLWQAYDLVGEWPEDNITQNQVLITNLFRERNPDLNLDIGNDIILCTPLYNESFQIIGIIDDINNNGRMLYTSLDTLNRFMKVEPNETLCDTIAIQLYDRNKEIEVVDALSANEFITAKAWNIIGMSFWKEQNISQIKFLSFFFAIMGLFTVLIAIIGGVNAYLMTILEREKEFGILKLIGAKPRWISFSLLWEALFTGMIASVMGILFGRFIVEEALLSVIKQLFIPIPVNFTLNHIMLGIIISLITAFLGVLYPSLKASKATVISGLKYE